VSIAALSLAFCFPANSLEFMKEEPYGTLGASGSGFTGSGAGGFVVAGGSAGSGASPGSAAGGDSGSAKSSADPSEDRGSGGSVGSGVTGGSPVLTGLVSTSLGGGSGIGFSVLGVGDVVGSGLVEGELAAGGFGLASGEAGVVDLLGLRGADGSVLGVGDAA
jgi:hypothetical protein